MTSQTGWREARSLRERDVGVQWAALLFLSVLFVLALEAARLPAALLLGPKGPCACRHGPSTPRRA